MSFRKGLIMLGCCERVLTNTSSDRQRPGPDAGGSHVPAGNSLVL
jgi:hypothetical protein